MKVLFFSPQTIKANCSRSSGLRETFFKDFIEKIIDEERRKPNGYEPSKKFTNFIKALMFEMESNYDGLTENVTEKYDALVEGRTRGELESKLNSTMLY